MVLLFSFNCHRLICLLRFLPLSVFQTARPLWTLLNSSRALNLGRFRDLPLSVRPHTPLFEESK